jgi:hypothetical protein
MLCRRLQRAAIRSLIILARRRVCGARTKLEVAISGRFRQDNNADSMRWRKMRNRGSLMKSAIARRCIVLAGHKAKHRAVLKRLADMAGEQHQFLSELIGAIDAACRFCQSIIDRAVVCSQSSSTARNEWARHDIK